MKMEMAVASDQQIKMKFESNGDGFALLSKTRQDLSAMIPQSPESSGIAQNPVVMSIKEQLAKLDVIHGGKENVMSEGVAMIDQFNAVEELMKVNSGSANKNEVFEA